MRILIVLLLLATCAGAVPVDPNTQLNEPRFIRPAGSMAQGGRWNMDRARRSSWS